MAAEGEIDVQAEITAEGEALAESGSVDATVEITEGIEDTAKFDGGELTDGVFTDYKISNFYEADGQIYMMPVTSPNGFDGDQVSFVKLAAGTLLWIVDWTAEKVNAKPSIPNPALDDANLVLMDKHFEPEGLLLKPSGDGAVIHRISGRYVYGHKNPNQARLWYGRPPWMDKSVDCEVGQDQFKDGIITCNTSTGGGSASATADPDAGPQSTAAFDATFQ